LFPFVVDKLVFFDLVVCCWSNFIKGSKFCCPFVLLLDFCFGWSWGLCF
jgi:hypothetical protein